MSKKNNDLLIEIIAKKNSEILELKNEIDLLKIKIDKQHKFDMEIWKQRKLEEQEQEQKQQTKKPSWIKSVLLDKKEIKKLS